MKTENPTIDYFPVYRIRRGEYASYAPYRVEELRAAEESERSFRLVSDDGKSSYWHNKHTQNFHVYRTRAEVTHVLRARGVEHLARVRENLSQVAGYLDSMPGRKSGLPARIRNLLAANEDAAELLRRELADIREAPEPNGAEPALRQRRAEDRALRRRTRERRRGR